MPGKQKIEPKTELDYSTPLNVVIKVGTRIQLRKYCKDKGRRDTSPVVEEAIREYLEKRGYKW